MSRKRKSSSAAQGGKRRRVERESPEQRQEREANELVDLIRAGNPDNCRTRCNTMLPLSIRRAARTVRGAEYKFAGRNPTRVSLCDQICAEVKEVKQSAGLGFLGPEPQMERKEFKIIPGLGLGGQPGGFGGGGRELEYEEMLFEQWLRQETDRIVREEQRAEDERMAREMAAEEADRETQRAVEAVREQEDLATHELLNEIEQTTRAEAEEKTRNLLQQYTQLEQEDVQRIANEAAELAGLQAARALAQEQVERWRQEGERLSEEEATRILSEEEARRIEREEQEAASQAAIQHMMSQQQRRSYYY